MKYKNRLILPTLVTTSLLASTMVANAEEVDQDEQNSGQSTEEYSVSDETSKTDIDFIESEEASEEETDDEKSESDNEEKESEESDEETDELEEVEETEATPAEEVDENTLDENNIEEITESPEEPVEDTVPAEQPAESEQNLEAPVEASASENNSEENIAVESDNQETVEQNAESEVAAPVEPAETETVETEEVEENILDEINVEEAAPVEEPVENEQDSETPVEATASEDNTEEDVAVESDNQDTEVQNSESEDVAPAEEQSVDAEEAAPAETVEEEVVEENTLDETDTEEETTESPEEPVEEAEPAEEPVESEQDSEAPVEATASEDNSEEDTAAESNEETVDPVESEEQETEKQENEIPESEVKDTYKYDSESLEQELENLSEEEQTAFLEENADDIEVDEELLNSLSKDLAANNEEINADEVFAATASTLSTMSLSQAITDVNQYIADNNFEVAEIQYDYIPGLPNYAYHSNHGWNPENGVVGKPEGVVLHDVGNDNSTIYGEIEYMTRNQDNAFVHAFVDANNIIQVADTDYLAYGAGEVSNQLHMHVELMRHDNAHDFAKSINNYADYIANLLYKYKLPVVSAEETGEGTLFSHVAVSNHLGGTASPDPYEYFARFDYEYNDVISLIGERYSDMFNKRTNPQISMPVEQGTTDLVAEVNSNNLGLYESVTDVRTKNASDLLGQQFRVVRTATYNYDEYYLLEDENGVSLGWMYAGDLTTSEYVPEVEQEEDLNDQEPQEPQVPAEPAEPTEPEEDESDDEQQDKEPTPEEDESNNVVEEDNEADEEQNDELPTEPKEDSDENSNNNVDEGSDDDNQNQEESTNPETAEEPVQPQPENDASEGSEETDDSTEESPAESEDNENQEEPANTDTLEPTDDVENESDNQTEENNNDDSNQESAEQEAEVSDENAEDTNQTAEENEVTTESDTNTDGEVSSSLTDSATGVRVVSATDELEGKSIVVTMMNPSNAIGAAHDLYDIHILDEDGSLYRLNNPVTVYLPANGYVSNVYYLGDIGETLQAVNYRTEDGYAVFEVDSFSQYAVVYGNSNEDNTTITPVSGDKGTGGEDMATDQVNEHPLVYTEKDVNSEDEAVAAGSDDANQGGSGEVTETEEAEMLPDTGTPEQNTTIFAAILAALGLGFLVKRRKTTEK